MTDREIATRPVTVLDRAVAGLFDYAGMFPPASLPFEEALRCAAAFEQTLARPHLVAADAVLPYDRLAATSADQLRAAGFAASRMVRVAVLGSPLERASAGPGESSSEPDSGPCAEAEKLALRNRETAGQRPGQRIESFEVKLPHELSGSEAAAAIGRLARLLAATGIRVFVEPERPDRDRSDELVAVLVNLKREGQLVGLKVRGSGPTAIDPDQLARVVAAVADHELPFKATAGLHHPLIEDRHGNTLGFLALLVALRLRQALGPERMPVDAIARCLVSADPRAFEFSRSVRWEDREIGPAALAGAMQAVSFSIGSCSLAEPDADLVRLFDS